MGREVSYIKKENIFQRNLARVDSLTLVRVIMDLDIGANLVGRHRSSIGVSTIEQPGINETVRTRQTAGSFRSRSCLLCLISHIQADSDQGLLSGDRPRPANRSERCKDR